ncbi:MAG: DUF669 domain-containing protein [Sedimentisphaeraceae bacterium JB056]
MASLKGFNANEVDPIVGFDPVPEDKYVAMITASEMKPTKNGSGSYLELTFDIIDGKYTGRKVWTRLNLDNQNATAVKMARGELSAICRAVGVPQPQDSVQLHNLPLVIKVVCRNRDDSGEVTNEIKMYESRQSITPPPPAPPVAASGTKGKAPWER